MLKTAAHSHTWQSGSTAGRLDPDTVTAGPASAGFSQPTTLTSTARIDELAGWLLSPHRDRHVVVITTADGRPTPYVDAQWAASQWPDAVEVYVVANGDLTRRLERRLPDGCAVFGGAARIYPAARPWRGEALTAPRFIASNRAEGREAQGALRAEVDVLLRAPAGATGHPYQPDGTVHVIDTEAAARELAAYLKHPARRVPVVVASVHPNWRRPFIDAERMALELRDAASVVVLGADASFGLTEGLGDRRFSAFFGAGRVYGVGTAWLGDERLSTLRMCDAGRGPAVTSRLIGDALAAAHSAGLLGRPHEHRPTDKPVTAKVKGHLSDYAVLVECDRETAAMLVADLVPGVDPTRLVARGQRLSGRLRSTGSLLPRFIPALPDDDPLLRVRETVPLGSIALARVAHVDSGQATLHLHPQVTGTLRAGDGEDLRGLLSPEDVVPVEVWWLDEGLQLALVDATDDFAAVPVPVLPGGPAWLEMSDLEPAAEPEPIAAPALPALQTYADLSRPGPLTSELDHLRRQLRMMEEAAAEYLDRIGDLEGQLTHWRTVAQRAKGSARKARSAAQVKPVFDDPEQQLRHEVWLTFLDRFSEAERSVRPLPQAYRVGADFIESMEALQGISRQKVLQVLVEVLTGLDAEMPSRQLHRWLSGRAGEPQVRADGAAAWRVSLQVNTPGARRLKYWRLPGGLVEFDSVGHHDDGL